MSKEVTGYEAIHIKVDCEGNDSVDIKCGGPYVLGYDFYVDSDCDMNEMRKFIKSELTKNNQPLMHIIEDGKTIVKKCWTKELISECIKNGY